MWNIGRKKKEYAQHAKFKDRREAGRHLTARLKGYAGRDNVLVLALPRGGVPVGYEIARALRAPLDVFVARKLGAPGQEELAIGAIASGGARALNRALVAYLGISDEEIKRIARRESRELERRERAYRDNRPAPDIADRVVILVDDGLATGATMRAAVTALRQLDPAMIVVAVPVAPTEACAAFQDIVDDLICVIAPEPFDAIGQWYEEFSQVTDEEVQDLLRRHAWESSALKNH